MAKAPSVMRGIALNTVSDDITNLYVIRAAGEVDHKWRLLDANLTLELGAADRARIVLETVLRKGLAPTEPDPKTALFKAKSCAVWRRRAGTPALFRINVNNWHDSRVFVEAVRATAPSCGLLLRSDGVSAEVDHCPSEDFCRLEPELDEVQLERLFGLEGTLSQFTEDVQ